jgi:hypothetical protein
MTRSLPACSTLAFVAIAFAACRDKPTLPVVTAASAAGPPMASASLDGGPPRAFIMDAGPRDGGSLEDVRKAETAYLNALQSGRKLTLLKKYESALVSFDAALAVHPGDARATSERGYTRLLSGDRTGAAVDFEEAAEATTDAKLLGQIWFNRGLVEYDDANARVAFYLSNQYAPNAAAKHKLGEGPVCPILIARPEAAPSGQPTIAASDMPRLYDAACKFENEECAGGDPWSGTPTAPVVNVRETNGHGKSYLVTRSAGGFEGYEVGATWGGRCPGVMSFEVAKASGALVHVHGFERGEGGYAYMCAFPEGDARPCSTGDWDKPGVQTQSFCAGGTLIERDVVIDTAKKRIVLSIERPLFGQRQDPADPKGPRVPVELVQAGLAAQGLGCDATIPWEVAVIAGATASDAGRDAAMPTEPAKSGASR